MKSILRALALSGVLGLGAMAAQAQVRIGVGVGVGPMVVAAVPPCPGVGYIWTPGYYYGNVWMPGRWMYRGGGYVGAYSGGYHGGYYARGWDHDGYRADGWNHGRDFHADHGDFHRR
ncbi:MAG: hypothetical protein WB622_13250 [Acidobacteriaceae bacterium]